MRRNGAVAAFSLALAMGGCATARNYGDPAGPVVTGGGTERPPARPDLRIVTFNLKFARHVDRAITLLSRSGPLRDADLLVMQEMDGPGTQRIAQALGLNYVFIPSAVHPSSGRDFGVAILSRWPLEAPRKLPLPHQHRFRKLRRAAAVATLVGPWGQLRVYGLHLESPLGLWGSDRRDQARVILADLADWSGPAIVAGDFNGRGGADEIARNGFLWATRTVRRTAGLFSFDHILSRGLCSPGPAGAGSVDDEVDASDHEPVWATLARCPAQASESSSDQGGVPRLSPRGRW